MQGATSPKSKVQGPRLAIWVGRALNTHLADGTPALPKPFAPAENDIPRKRS
jgi:hypothetical protein